MKTKRWFDETTQLPAHSTPHPGVPARREKIVLFGLAVALLFGTANLTDLQAQQTNPRAVPNESNAKVLVSDKSPSAKGSGYRSRVKRIVLFPVRWFGAMFHHDSDGPRFSSFTKQDTGQEAIRRGTILGSASFINAATEEFVDDAPDVMIELDFQGRRMQLRSDRFAALSESLPVGKYCLKSANNASNGPLAFHPKQHKCFIIKTNHVTRFDLMLIRP